MFVLGFVGKLLILVAGLIIWVDIVGPARLAGLGRDAHERRLGIALYRRGRTSAMLDALDLQREVFESLVEPRYETVATSRDSASIFKGYHLRERPPKPEDLRLLRQQPWHDESSFGRFADSTREQVLAGRSHAPDMLAENEVRYVTDAVRDFLISAAGTDMRSYLHRPEEIDGDLTIASVLAGVLTIAPAVVLTVLPQTRFIRSDCGVMLLALWAVVALLLARYPPRFVLALWVWLRTAPAITLARLAGFALHRDNPERWLRGVALAVFLTGSVTDLAHYVATS